MDDHDLRKFTQLGKFFPRRIAKALKSVIEGIPNAHYANGLVSLCIWEPDATVDLSGVHFYVVWDDSDGRAQCAFEDALSEGIRDKMKDVVSSIEIEYLALSEVLVAFAAHEETTRSRLAKSIVLFDQETIVPLKALLEMKEEWDYKPFTKYLRTSPSSKSNNVTEETAKIKEELKAAVPSDDEWSLRWDREAALCTLAQTVQKFQPYVDGAILVPQIDAFPMWSGTVLVLINDTDVETMQRVELKLKIQSRIHRFEADHAVEGLVSLVLLTEFYDMFIRNPKEADALLSNGCRLQAKPLWDRLRRLSTAMANALPREGSVQPKIWDASNVPLWLGRISPNLELRGYEKRKVSGAWGKWQAVVGFANRHEFGIVTCFVWLFIITFLTYLGLISGFASVKVPLFLVGFVVLFPLFMRLFFRGLVKLGWGRYSPFIMPIVVSVLWTAAILGSNLLRPTKGEGTTTIDRLETIRTRLTTELEETSQRLRETFKELEAADTAQHQAIQAEIGSLTIHKEQIAKDISTLETVRSEQAETLGRLYVDQVKQEFQIQNATGQRWDILVNIIALLVGALVGQVLGFVVRRIASKRKGGESLSV